MDIKKLLKWLEHKDVNMVASNAGVSIPTVYKVKRNQGRDCSMRTICKLIDYQIAVERNGGDLNLKGKKIIEPEVQTFNHDLDL